MSTIVEAPEIAVREQTVQHSSPDTLRASVEAAMKNYFAQLGDQSASNIYEMVISEVEAPLLEAVMQFTKGNQSKAAILLGISRGTLRKKLKHYGIEKIS